MDIPAPPQDEELRNIIDKLAVFVARNGQAFESMTKQKQSNNPRFAFLFGGEFYNYYMYRVTTEQAILKHKATRDQQQGANMMGNNFGMPNFPGNQGGGMMNQPQPRFPVHQNIPNRGPGPNQMPGFDRGSFDQRPPVNFDHRHSGPGPGMQNFDRPPMNRLPFQQHNPNPRPQGNFPPQGGFFERPPQQGNGPRPNFDIDQRSGFQQPPVSGNFERGVPQQFSQNYPAQSQPPPAAVPVITAPAAQPPTAPTINVEALQAQKLAMEEQIRQSEQNLAGQHQVLLAQQQKQIEDSIRIMQDAEIKQLAAELNVNLEEFDSVLAPIAENCTKDSISSGKAWIFTHTSTQRHYQLVAQYLLRKTLDPKASFETRLHIIYLINDVLHHCMRKGADDLQAVLESIVIPMFCYAKVSEINNKEETERLDKLVALWESKSSYVTPSALQKLKSFSTTWQEYQTELLQRYASIVTQIAGNINQTYEGYQNQHQLFCQHVTQSIKGLEQQIQQGIAQQQQQLQLQQQQLQLQQQQQQLQMGARPPVVPPGLGNVHPPGMGPPGPSGAIIGQGFPPPMGHVPPRMEMQGPPAPGLFDLSKPPPGFQGTPPTPPPEADLIPKIEYYELPAGLMVPLVKLDDDRYKPTDPKAIRLPPPCPPSERLVQAVEAFYAPATHERPRDSEGWERLGLYEYFKSKNTARKQKEDDIREGRRERSRSPTPIRRELSPTTHRSPPRRRYHSKSPTPPRRRRSRSRSPARRKRSSRRSRSRSRSPEPLRRRSPTPPSFATMGLGMEKKLDESNKGHQLLKKMGWGGSGLGRDEQGIEAPISGGEIREKKDQYRGVGINPMNDPFESYRKSKGQAFVERMRARAEERL